MCFVRHQVQGGGGLQLPHNTNTSDSSFWCLTISLITWLDSPEVCNGSCGLSETLFPQDVFIGEKKKPTHLPPERMGLRQNTTQSLLFEPVNKVCLSCSWGNEDRWEPRLCICSQEQLICSSGESYVLGETYAPYCAPSSHRCKGLEALSVSQAQGGMCRSRSWCPCSTLNHVLGSLAGAAILAKQIFVHFNKGLSPLIHPVHILIKIQTLTLSGTFGKQAVLCYSSHTHLSSVSATFVSL